MVPSPQDVSDKPTQVFTHTVARPRTLKEALAVVRPYAVSSNLRAWFQVLTASLLFAALLGFMLYLGLEHYGWVLLLSIPLGLTMVRLFTLQHDCGHGSLFTNRKLNDAVGSVFALLTVTPYQYWRAAHAIHHATTGNLDKRGTGDIETKTIEEYQTLPLREKIFYRLIRNPFFLFGIGGFLHFAIKQRFPILHNNLNPIYLKSVHRTNAVMVLALIGIHFTYGIGPFLAVFLPAIWIASVIGFWLFYVQHSYHDAYWQRQKNWDYLKSAFDGSTLVNLPPVLRWISADIGIHHIHHLLPSIPNYKLRACMIENPHLCTPREMKLKEAITCTRLAIWDEVNEQLIPFSEMKERLKANRANEPALQNAAE
ncbi:fatty acid desaturase [Sneathiella limimaris]|uniref:fatty acid desaturase n=1 Tax=Sneathiella limimaris TaxID=1964213 RepID=UPI00146D29AA|nr:fatty acid desaturase [Sneathiella limimaris]